jgi:hypothetical protein
VLQARPRFLLDAKACHLKLPGVPAGQHHLVSQSGTRTLSQQVLSTGVSASEPMPSLSPKETSGKTMLFQVGESSYGPRYLMYDRQGSLPS